MYTYKYVPPRVILHHYVSVTPVTIITVSYNKRTISIAITVQKYMKKPLNIVPWVPVNCLPFTDSNKYLSYAYKIHSDPSKDVSYGCFLLRSYVASA